MAPLGLAMEARQPSPWCASILTPVYAPQSRTATWTMALVEGATRTMVLVADRRFASSAVAAHHRPQSRRSTLSDSRHRSRGTALACLIN
jgi:hypothetical protein